MILKISLNTRTLGELGSHRQSSTWRGRKVVVENYEQRYGSSLNPQPVFSWDGDDDIPEVYLHWRVPSLAQQVEQELKFKLPGTDHVCRQGPYGMNSATWELYARAAAKPLTAAMDSDVPDLIEDEDHPQTLTAVWDSLDDRSAISRDWRRSS